jgi:hypothetical protein
MSNRCVLVCFLLTQIFACAPRLLAQSEATGAIYGLVLTPDGRAATGAAVRAHEPSTGAEAMTSSGATGAFLLSTLPPGSYELTVTATGFAPCQRTAVVEIGRVTTLHLELRLPRVEEKVEVSAQEPLVETTQPSVAHNIGAEALEGLPSNSRRWSNLALLTPSALPDGSYGLISFRGLAGVFNSSRIDGGDNNQAYFSEERGRTRLSYVMGQNAVREFQVNLSNFSAEYGGAAGGSVNAITRSGGNRLRGEAFYYLRDSALGAQDPYAGRAYFNEGNGEYQEKHLEPEDRRQQFGISAGGPIRHDKLFYFFNLDIQRHDFPGVAAAASASLFEPPCVLAKTTQQVLALNALPYLSECNYDELSTVQKVMPLSTSTLGAYAAWLQAMAYLNGFTGEVARQANHTIIFPKLDWRINRNHSLSLSYNLLRWQSPGGTQTAPVTNLGTSSWGDSGVKVDTLQARLTSALPRSEANELRLLYSRDLEYDRYKGAAADEPRTGPYGYAPEVRVGGYDGLSFGMPASLSRPKYPDERRVELADSMALMRGRHLLKFGGSISRVHDDADNLYGGGGSYDYTYRDEFAADYLFWQNGNQLGWRSKYSYYDTYSQSFGQAEWRFATWDFAGFAQDEWRTGRHLTLTLGVRYEKQRLPGVQAANSLLTATEHLPADNNNFAPRVGFAWQPFGNGRTVLRGGYGIYYSRLSNATSGMALSNTGTEQAQRSYTWFAKEGPLFPYTMTDPYGTLAADVFVLSPRLQMPMVHQGDLVLEREIAPHTLLSVSGLLSVGHELPRYVDANFVDPATSGGVVSYTISGGPWSGETLTMPLYTERLNTSFARIIEARSDVNSVYSALVAHLRRRKAQGLMYELSYTWSHALDNGQGSSLFGSSNGVLSPYEGWYSIGGVTRLVKDSERGNSNYDVRHNVVAMAIYEPKFRLPRGSRLSSVVNGWAIAPVLHFNSGRPLSEYVAGSASNIPDACQSCYGINGAGGQDRLPFLDRNSWRLPPNYYLDLRLSRRMRVGERRQLTVMAEAFNLLNHRNVTSETSELYYIRSDVLYYDANFGTATGAGNALYREREIQLGVKYSF